MTERNTFCWSTEYNDDNSFQQERFRIFNQVYNHDTYHNITVNINKILKDTKLNEITQDQIKLIKAIPDLIFNDYGFTYITGVVIDEKLTGVVIDEKLTDVEKAIELLTSKGMIRDGKVIHLS
jgi:hypothetical protein